MGTKKKTESKTNEPQDEYVAQPEATAAPKTKGKKKAKPEQTDAPQDAQPDVSEPPEVKTGPTLEDAAASYLASLDADGAGDGTLSSYKMELNLAMRELGESTLLADLTPERVGEYFACDAVMKTRHGNPKAKPTWAKSIRVFRQCLVDAAAKGMIELAPIPTPAPKKLRAV